MPWRWLPLFAIVWTSATPSGFRQRWTTSMQRAVVLRPDVLHHADRDDAIERAVHVAVVLRAADLDRQVLPLRLARPERCCSFESVTPRTVQPYFSAAQLAKPPQPQPRSSTRIPGCEADLAADEIELGLLRLVERLARSSSSRRCRPCAGRASPRRGRCRCRSASRRPAGARPALQVGDAAP